MSGLQAALCCDQVSRLRQGLPFGFVRLDDFSYNCAKILEDLLRIVAVWSAMNRSGHRPNSGYDCLPLKQSIKRSEYPSRASFFISSCASQYAKPCASKRLSPASACVCKKSSVNSLDRSLISFICVFGCMTDE